MKNFFKVRIAPLFGLAVFIVAIGFSIVGCKTDDTEDNDYEMLNGVWDRGDIVVTFNNSDGVFTQINSNSGWETVQNRGHIKIGDKKFKNITGGNLKWTAQTLTYDLNTYVLKDWEDCTITMDAGGQTLQTITADVTNPVSTYTRVK